jgi:hypothetical protein
MKINEIQFVNEIKILSSKINNNSQLFEKILKKKEKEYNLKLTSMIYELNKKDIIIEQLKKELFKYYLTCNKNNNIQMHNEFEKKIKKLEKKNNILNNKLLSISYISTIGNDEKKKFQIEKNSIFIKGNSNKNNLKSLEKIKNKTPNGNVNKTDNYYIKKLLHNKNKLKIYEKQISFLSNSNNELIQKNGNLEKERLDLEDIIFKQEDKITKLNNILGKYNLSLMEKNIEMNESNNFYKNFEGKNMAFKKIKLIKKDKNHFHNKNNSFDTNLNYKKIKNTINFPIIKLKKEINNISPIKNKDKLNKISNNIEQNENEKIQEIKNMIEDLVKKF